MLCFREVKGPCTLTSDATSIIVATFLPAFIAVFQIYAVHTLNACLTLPRSTQYTCLQTHNHCLDFVPPRVWEWNVTARTSESCQRR